MAWTKMFARSAGRKPEYSFAGYIALTVGRLRTMDERLAGELSHAFWHYYTMSAPFNFTKAEAIEMTKAYAIARKKGNR